MKARAKILGLLLVFGAIGMTQTGCTMFSKMFKKKKSSYQLRKERRAARMKEGAKTYKVLAAKKGCDGIKAGYMKIYSYAAGTKERRAKTAIHLAKCGHWDVVFGQFAKSNQRYLNYMMDQLVSAGLPVHKAYAKWLNTAERPYKGTVGWYTFTWTRNWLAKSSKAKSLCKAMWDNRGRATRPMYPKYRWRVRSMMIGYLHMANCRSYHRQVASLLTSNSWRDRNQACAFMKDWGKASDLRKVRILASTDSYFFIRRRVRVYPVRNSCRAAAGRIRMRN